MNNRANLIFSLFAICLLATAWTPKDDRPHWEVNMYEQYDPDSFSTLPIANSRIEAKKIDYALLDAAIFYETNRMRKAKGLEPLQYSRALEKAAFSHSSDMVRHQFIGHESKVKGKATLLDRLELVGISNVYCAENVCNSFLLEMIPNKPFYVPSQNGGYFSYEFQGDPIETKTYLDAGKTIVQQWMNSPGHQKNILNPNYLFMGSGAYVFVPKNFDETPMIYATQVFSSADTDYEAHPVEFEYK